jgi:signal transduction histidine kinase
MPPKPKAVPSPSPEDREVAFDVDARVIQELGERLFESAELAVVELIKNAYDADATDCWVDLQGTDRLTVRDSGTGMTESTFRKRWMRIATGEKARQGKSTKFNRPLTGSKGVGRFAVRFLGDYLTLESIADVEIAGKPNQFRREKLTAEFDWLLLEKEQHLADRPIHYQISEVSPETPLGTTLEIRKLRTAAKTLSSVTVGRQILRLTTPASVLRRGHMARSTTDDGDRFETYIQQTRAGDHEFFRVADEILEHAWATLTIEAKEKAITYDVKFRDGSKFDFRRKLKFDLKFPKGFYADIRFFPRRAGALSKISIGAKAASEWIKEWGGVTVVDNGFGVEPYGTGVDDWLNLSADAAANRRDWRSSFMKEYYPIPTDSKNRPAFNPALYLPTSHQLVGTVFVSSLPPTSGNRDDLLAPAITRHGFLENAAFFQLHDAVRGGIELLGFLDAKDQELRQEQELKKYATAARKNISRAIHRIERVSTLSDVDKRTIVSTYTELAKKVDDIESYHGDLRYKLDQMALLGAVAGFMTHECNRIIYNLKRCVERLESLASKDDKLIDAIEAVKSSLQEFEEHIDYTATFTYAVQKATATSFLIEPQVRRVLSKFDRFADERGVEREVDVTSGLKGPILPVTVYSGILLNLYSNALKAVVAPESKNGASRRILIRAHNAQGRHILEVLDNGVGIPEELRERIWDPLFTTTSRINNPLGSGMGLGLALIKRLIEDLKGRIRVEDAASPFVTRFVVELPLSLPSKS